MKDRKGFCYEIFKNQAVWTHNGTISYNPCSFYDGFIEKDLPPDEVWFGQMHRKIIQVVQQDKLVPGCHRCYAEESAGRLSRRQSSKLNYENFLQSDDLKNCELGPEGIDYSVGNLCNLKCMVCGPHNSSAWISDFQKIWPNQEISQFIFKKNQQTEITDEKFLTNVKSIHFHGGGEPLMSGAHVNLLLAIEKVKGLGDVRVYYNTNGTQIVNEQVLELWEKCRLIEIYFSIDDVGQRFEYQRTGAKWNNIIQNIGWYKRNMPNNHMFNINCVWGYLNLYYLDELWDWYQETLPTNRYGDPCRLILQKAIGPFEIKHLGPAVLVRLQEKFSSNQSLLSLLGDIKSSNDSHDLFWKHVKKIDRVRGNDFRDICPEWSACL